MWTILIAFLCSALCVIIHCHGLRLAGYIMHKLRFRAHNIIAIGTSIILIVHILEICVFASGYLLADDFSSNCHLSSGGELLSPDWRTAVYFSFVTFATTGYGDYVPMGEYRVIATMESLLGIVMVGWSASFLFLQMNRYKIALVRDLE